ncbi:DUF4388 domain-containing protein [Thermus igniterrae]|uniref:DUF4388 domain-containing protein n=1 Tax=Thermus igniterrae TaxID=88189 RepID=UPI0003A7DA7E|nr:DUF4388 domain-containing protein [Thermus igniterrae]
MALLGNLNSIRLEEILQILAQREGALELWNLKDIPPTTLYLKPGRIRSVDQKGKPLDPLAAKAVLQALLQAREGSFEFIPGAKPPHGVRLGWPVERVLLGLITLQDEMAQYQAQLPHPQMVFLYRPPACPGEALEAPGRDFLERARPHLERGASAEELAQALGLPLDTVRFYLFRLEAKGWVRAAGWRRPAQGWLRWLGGGR